MFAFLLIKNTANLLQEPTVFRVLSCNASDIPLVKSNAFMPLSRNLSSRKSYWILSEDYRISKD